MVWLDWSSNPGYTAIEASRLTITPPMWFGPSTCRLYGNKEFDLMKITKTLHWSCDVVFPNFGNFDTFDTRITTRLVFTTKFSDCHSSHLKAILSLYERLRKFPKCGIKDIGSVRPNYTFALIIKKYFNDHYHMNILI